MKLRRAKSSDYEIIKEIYEDIDMQCFYTPQYSPERPQEMSKYDKLFLEGIEEMVNADKERFETKLSLEQFEESKSNFLVIENENNEVCGYFLIDCYRKNKWRIYEWGGYECQKNKKEMLETLISYCENMKRKTRMELTFLPIYPEDKKLLEEFGFSKYITFSKKV